MTEPYLLFVHHDGEVIATNIAVWAGFTKGEAVVTTWEQPTPTYNCQSPEKAFFPTNHIVSFDESTGRTSTKIHGSLKDCSGESYTEVIEFLPKEKKGKKKKKKVDGKKKKSKKKKKGKKKE